MCMSVAKSRNLKSTTCRRTRSDGPNMPEVFKLCFACATPGPHSTHSFTWAYDTTPFFLFVHVSVHVQFKTLISFHLRGTRYGYIPMGHAIWIYSHGTHDMDMFPWWRTDTRKPILHTAGLEKQKTNLPQSEGTCGRPAPSGV